MNCGIYVVLVCVCVRVCLVKLCLMCLISFPVLVVNASWVGNCSEEYCEIHMSCSSGVTSHFITFAAEHDCVLFLVLQS